MKGIIIKLPLGKRDNVIAAWIELVIGQGGNFSRSVDYAIVYFAKTGKYLNLGNISLIPSEIGATAKNIYFAENSPAVEWLAERKRNGEKEATSIKRILRRCLTQNEDQENCITGIDDLYDIVQEAVMSAPRVQETMYQVQEDALGRKQEASESMIDKPSELAILETESREDEIEEDPDDITDAVLGNLFPEALKFRKRLEER